MPSDSLCSGPRSAPEIFLTIIGIIGNNFQNDELGSNLIIGSGAFNILVITAISICVIPAGQTRKIENYPLFIVSIFFSMLAFVWLLVILRFVTPGKVEVWEAALTVLFLPVLCLSCYITEKFGSQKSSSVTLTVTNQFFVSLINVSEQIGSCVACQHLAILFGQ